MKARRPNRRAAKRAAPKRITPSEQVIVLREHLAVSCSHVRRLLVVNEQLNAGLDRARTLIAQLKVQLQTRVEGTKQPLEVVWPKS